MSDYINKNFNNIFYFTLTFSIFPFWILAGSSKTNFIILFFFSLFLVFITVFFTKNFINKFSLNKKKRLLILSLFLTYGFDLNFKLLPLFQEIYRNITQSSFQNIYFYFFALICLMLIFVGIYNLLKLNSKNTLIFMTMMIVLVIFNIFNLINNIYFYNYDFNANVKYVKKIKNTSFDSKTKDKTVVIFLDNLSGYYGIDEKIANGLKTKNSFENTFKANSFTLYKKAYSMYFNTDISVSASLNFNFEKNQIKEIKKYRSLSKNEYYKWQLNKNRFFEKFSDSKIYTTTNRNINFCDQKFVSLCERFFPNQRYNFLENLKFTKKDNFFYLLHASKSILNKIIWRTFLASGIVHDYPIWTYLKANFPQRLSTFAKNIVKTDYDLYFAHYLVPHSPLGYKLSNNNKCSFDYKLMQEEKTFTLKKEMSHHYDEIICVNFFMNDFFNLLKKSNHFDNLTIIILSDTGSGYGYDPEKREINFQNTYPALFAIKENIKKNKSHKDNSQKWSTQYLFSYYLNDEHKEPNNNEKIIYDHYNLKYLNYK